MKQAIESKWDCSYGQAAKSPTEAFSLPAEAYISDTIFDAELESLFRRQWICAGRVDQVPEPGDYFSIDLLGDKLVIVRGKDEQIRVLSRVCRHRSAELVSGTGKTNALVCPYHAWTYRLDGALHKAPLMGDVEGFDEEKCALPEIRSEIWEGWIFVNFDARAESLATQLAPLSETLKRYDMSSMVATHTAVFDSEFNWKVLVDNFMEAYHHIAIHNDSFEPLFPAKQSYVPENQGPYSVLRMPLKKDADLSGALPPLPSHGKLNAEEQAQLVAAVVFPCHLFAPTAESLTWYHVLPQSSSRFELRIYTCLPRETLDNEAHSEAIEALKEFVTYIHGQDIKACEAVWEGLQSRCAKPGRLSILEKAIWQFNQWWLEQMRID